MQCEFARHRYETPLRPARTARVEVAPSALSLYYG